MFMFLESILVISISDLKHIIINYLANTSERVEKMNKLKEKISKSNY